MTDAILCDWCNKLVSASDPSRSDEDRDDPARRWWQLTQGPTVGGGLLQPVTLQVNADGYGDPFEEPEPPPPVEPDRHFCSDECLAAWTLQRATPEVS